MTGKQLLDELKAVGAMRNSFRFPYVYLQSVSPEFDGKDDDEREALASEIIGRSIAEIRKTATNCMFTLQWLTPAEAAQQQPEARGEHWLRAFTEAPNDTPSPSVQPSLRVAHFFGYKGGQGRSTVLACLAQKLAEDGAKVLVLDADIEAPSLDVLFGVKPSGAGSTLLGLVRQAPSIQTVPALQGRKGGEVRLIACRPRDPSYDIDFAAFAMQTNLMPGILMEAISRIREWAQQDGYSAVLVDHRSGMAMTTLTWMNNLPGPAVVFTKLDDQWRGAEGVLREVLQANPLNPGIIVTFKPDEETEDGFRRRTVRQRTDLLALLSEVVSEGAEITSDNLENEGMRDPFAIEDHWVLWPYDQAFRSTTLPDTASLGANTKGALSEITRLLDLRVPVTKKLSSIGSVDQGDLIQTEALTRLLQPGNTLRYIFGRKGTGKTRLATELGRRGPGEPLLVDASSDLGYGITTAEVEFAQARDSFHDQPECLWWALLLAALQAQNTARTDLRDRFAMILNARPAVTNVRDMVLQMLPQNGSREFLLDGIETAFGVGEVYAYVEALFLFMLALQSDDRFQNRVQVKLFLRSDLASRSVQNLEQQVSDQVIYLFWDYQKILCFMLARLPLYSFFRDKFPDMIAETETIMDRIRAGDISIEDAERILLQALPPRLPRFNILTSTFLRLHFADSSTQGASYYPRVIDSFLNELDAAGKQKGPGALIDGRLDQALLIGAHEKACKDYMSQIRQELQHLLDFGQPNPLANQTTPIEEWINAFSGQRTPFAVADMEVHLADRTRLAPSVVRRSLEQMLEMGIFEQTPETATWRTGRLFKSSLRMKYKRVGSGSV